MAADLNESEQNLIKSIRELGLKPRANSAEELKEWLTEYHDEENAAESDDEDVKPLRLTTNMPKLSTFYGDVEKLTKGEVVYDQWQYEVQSLIEENYKDKQIQQAIRRSLKGAAAKVLKRMPIGSSVIDILKKFESVYGSADSRATILRNFYSAEQEEGENVREWSCRLEELLEKAISQGLVIQGDNADSMLCDKFWSGLRPELRDITGHKYDSITDFDELRTEVKKIEYEHLRKEKKTISSTAKSAVSTKKEESTKAELEELRGMIKQVASSVENMGQEIHNLNFTVNRQQLTRGFGGRGRNQGPIQNWNRSRGPPQSNYIRGYGRGNTSRGPRSNQGSRGPSQYSQESGNQGGRGPSQYSQGPGNQERSNQYGTGDKQQAEREEHGATGTMYDYNRGGDNYRRWDYYDQGPICYRCGQPGHIQRYCRVRTDFLHRLN